MIDTLALEYLNGLPDILINPQKRIFIGYLLTALVIGTLWIRWRHGSGWRTGMRRMLSPRIWWSPSARADYKLLLINRFLMMLIAPALITQVTLATFIFQQFHAVFGHRPTPGSLLPDWAVMVGFTLFFFLLDDFARYGVHRLMHRWRWLWAFHKVHHSARTMTPLTVLRTHPVEGILFALRSTLVQATSIGLFLFWFGHQVDLITVLGVNVVVFAFNVTGANLRHSHVAIGYWKPLERILISPAQHQLHHSADPRHFNKNFGAMLAIWDWLGGSLYHSSRHDLLSFGLHPGQPATEQRLMHLYLKPFAESGQAIWEAVRRIIKAHRLHAFRARKNRY